MLIPYDVLKTLEGVPYEVLTVLSSDMSTILCFQLVIPSSYQFLLVSAMLSAQKYELEVK